MIVIINYGLGNSASIQNMIKRLGSNSIISSEIDVIEQANKIILPGVGSFDAAMRNIDKLGLKDVINKKVIDDKVPTLGICLGMQLMTNGSEEGILPGFGWINAKTLSFNKVITGNFKVPHMGWNHTCIKNKSVLTEGFSDEFCFYFVHSYCVKVENSINSILETTYEISFDSGIQKDNIFGVQFHPEKSHKYGMKLFNNFLNL